MSYINCLPLQLCKTLKSSGLPQPNWNIVLADNHWYWLYFITYFPDMCNFSGMDTSIYTTMEPTMSNNPNVFFHRSGIHPGMMYWLLFKRILFDYVFFFLIFFSFLLYLYRKKFIFIVLYVTWKCNLIIINHVESIKHKGKFLDQSDPRQSSRFPRSQFNLIIIKWRLWKLQRNRKNGRYYGQRRFVEIP